MLGKLAKTFNGDKTKSLAQKAVEATKRHPRIRPVLNILYTHRYVVIIPTALFTVLSLVYAIFGPKQYLASQALDVRNELIGQGDRAGKFPSWEMARTAQETILEISKNTNVIAQTLEQVGPPAGKAAASWPDDETIESMQDSISLHAPNGQELGKAEVVHLSVKESSRERAYAVIMVLLDNVELQLRKVRQERAASMEVESLQAMKIAREDLNNSLAKIKELEEQIGPDLPELRTLNQASAGEGSHQRELIQLRNELRDAINTQNLLEGQRKALKLAVNEPAHLIQTPNELLQLQPALNDLKKGLSEARLELARTQSQYTEIHPKTRNAKQKVEDTMSQIRAELNTALLGLETQQNLNTKRIALLNAQEQDLIDRKKNLARVRAEYDALQSEVNHRSDVLKKAQEQLNEAKSTRLAAEEVNLITRIEEPQVGSAPLGPSKKMIVLGGMLGGLMIGLGLVTFLSAPVGQQQFQVEAVEQVVDEPEHIEPLIEPVVEDLAFEITDELQTPTVSDNKDEKATDQRKEKEKPISDPNAIYILPDVFPQAHCNDPLQL